jgi:CopG-like RHH_1 or ribbon-helix-helix domain, RHH_5
MTTEKLTVVLDPRVRDELSAWAQEEDRPIANLMRRLVNKCLAERRAEQQQGGRAA